MMSKLFGTDQKKTSKIMNILIFINPSVKITLIHYPIYISLLKVKFNSDPFFSFLNMLLLIDFKIIMVKVQL
jgi:hypothetical protein